MRLMSCYIFLGQGDSTELFTVEPQGHLGLYADRAGPLPDDGMKVRNNVAAVLVGVVVAVCVFLCTYVCWFLASTLHPIDH